jgi:hypothetical protein
VLGKAASRARRLVKRVIRRLGYNVYRMRPETTDRSARGASKGLRVHIGCGEDTREGYLAWGGGARARRAPGCSNEGARSHI